MQNDQNRFHVEIAAQRSAAAPTQLLRIAIEALPHRAGELWLPSLAPSKEVWQHFSCETFQWLEFCRWYRKELAQRERACEHLRSLACRRPLCIVYGHGDEQHNIAMVLLQHLEELECRHRYAAGWIIGGHTWPVRTEIQRSGGLWFARHKAWTMPDEASWRSILSLLPGDF